MSAAGTNHDSNAPRNPKDFKKPFLTWIQVSCIVSAVIIAWAFSNAFLGREESIFSTRAKQQATPLMEAEPVSRQHNYQDKQRTYDRQVQELKILDDQLMKQAAKFTRRYDVPGERESKQYRERRTQMLREQANVLLSEIPDGELVEGTMEWDALEHMKATLDDYHQ